MTWLPWFFPSLRPSQLWGLESERSREKRVLLRRLDPSVTTASPFRPSSPFRGFTVPEGRTSRLPRIGRCRTPLVPRNTKRGPCRPAQGRRPEGMRDLRREWLWDLVAREEPGPWAEKKRGTYGLGLDAQQCPGERNQIHVVEQRKESSGGRLVVVWWPMDGPMVPSHLFSAHCSDGSIVSKHRRRRQRDGCQTVENPVGLRPVLLLDNSHGGVMEQLATLHLHATVEMTDVPRIVEDALDRVDRARLQVRKSAPVPCMWRRDRRPTTPSTEVLVWFAEVLAKAKLDGSRRRTKSM